MTRECGAFGACIVRPLATRPRYCSSGDQAGSEA